MSDTGVPSLSELRSARSDPAATAGMSGR
jgi:hypothetical protein